MRESFGFVRRCWHDQRGLFLAWLGCAVSLGAVGIVRTAETKWLTGLWLMLWLAVFVIWIMLIRRDEPPADR